MRTLLKLAPGKRGTKKLLERYGDRLVCVRYRYDAETRKRWKTVELVVEEVEWKRRSAPPAPETPVFVRVAYGEEALRKRVKQAGGKWDPEKKLWALPYGQAEALRLEARIVEGAKEESI